MTFDLAINSKSNYYSFRLQYATGSFLSSLKEIGEASDKWKLITYFFRNMYDKNPRQQNAILEKKLRGKLSVHFLKEISPGYFYFPEWQIYRKWNILFLNYVIILTTGLRAKVIKLEYRGVGVSTFFVDCTRFWRSTAPPGVEWWGT